MRILLFPSSYPPRYGGLESVVRALAKRLREEGHAVRVLTPRYPRSLARRESIDGVDIDRLFMIPPGFDLLRRRRPDLFLASLLLYPLTLLQMALLMRSFRPDIVNVHFPDAQVPFLLKIRGCFRFRLIASLHGDEITRWPAAGSPPPRLLELLRSADGITACSSWLRAAAARLDPALAGKIRVVHNGIEMEPFRRGTVRARARPYLLAFGRFTVKKGFDLLLRAFEPIAASFPGVDLVIAGDGEDRRLLESLRDSLGLKGRVEFPGYASARELAALLDGCEFAVVPSREESFGLSALEAMAAGKFLLASRIGGLTEFIDESMNRLVEPTVEGLAAGIRESLERLDQVKASGRGNRRVALAHTAKTMTAGYLEAYEAGIGSREA